MPEIRNSVLTTAQQEVLSLVDSLFTRGQQDANYKVFQGYYEGDHVVKLPSRVKEFLTQISNFRNNFCEVVVDVMAERMVILAVESPNEKVGNFLWNDFWLKEEMDRIAGLIHTQAAIKGDSYLIVDWDFMEGRPVASYNDASLIRGFGVSPNGDPRFYVKRWVIQNRDILGIESGDTRVNIYYRDRIEKYVGVQGGSLVRWMDPGDTSWPVWWTHNGTQSGEELGFPVFHFRNKTTVSGYGKSELSNVIPMQDFLNKTVVDLAAIADVQAFPQRWVTGADPPKGGWKTAPGLVWSLGSEQA